MPLADPARIASPNVVKAVLAADGRCLYFSRAAIPFARNGKEPKRYEHLGIYDFKREALERTESLEQLRALENGINIYAAVVDDVPIAIDIVEDLERAERLLRSMHA